MEAMAGLIWALLSSSLDLKKQTVVPIPTHLLLKGLLRGKLRVLTPEMISVLGELGCDLVCKEGCNIELPSGDVSKESSRWGVGVSRIQVRSERGDWGADGAALQDSCTSLEPFSEDVSPPAAASGPPLSVF